MEQWGRMWGARVGYGTVGWDRKAAGCSPPPQLTTALGWVKGSKLGT